MLGASLDHQVATDWASRKPGQPGWLTGTEAAACGARIAPVVTGSVDWQAIDAMAGAWIDAHGLTGHRQPCGCTCTPPAPLTGEQTAQLRRALLALAADAMSGPGGLAAYLRSRLPGAPWTAKSLPLDVGRAKDIPAHLMGIWQPLLSTWTLESFPKIAGLPARSMPASGLARGCLS